MSFAIVWNRDAVKDIDDAWDVASEDQLQTLEQAIGAIHNLLSDEPSLAGESRRTLDERVAYNRPLTVFFRIDRRLQIVRVYAAVVYFPSV